MNLLYRVGGVTGIEIGRIMRVDYSTESQGRTRLSEMIQKIKFWGDFGINRKEIVNMKELTLSSTVISPFCVDNELAIIVIGSKDCQILAKAEPFQYDNEKPVNNIVRLTE